MNYNGFVWIFKSPGVQLTLGELKQTLEDVGARQEGPWEVSIRDYSNHHSIMHDQKLKTKVTTVADTLLGSSVAIMCNQTKTQMFAYRKDIDALVRNLGLKLVQSIDIEGSVWSLGDLSIAYGLVGKNKGLTKEIILRVEMKSIVSTQYFEQEMYDTLGADIFSILGKQIRDAFYSESRAEQTKEFLKRESLKDQSDRKTKVVFDQYILARIYGDLFFENS